MAGRRPHRRKLQEDNDLQVPINGAILGEVLRETGTTPTQLAHQVETSAQNIADMVKTGATRRCRAGLRKRIAAKLRVSEALLAGEPVVFPGGPLVQQGYEYRYSVRTELAASRLLTHVAQACVRDLQQLGSPEQLGAVWPPVDGVVNTVIGHVSELIRVKDWRQKLLTWHAGVEEARGFTEPATENAWRGKLLGFAKPSRRKDVRWPRDTKVAQWQSEAPRPTDTEHEDGVIALIRSVEHLLKPWFEGQAALNYQGLRDLSRLPASRAEGIEERWHPHSPFASWPPGTEIVLPPGMKRTPNESSTETPEGARP